MRAGSPFARLIYRNRRRLLLFLALWIGIFSMFLASIPERLSTGYWLEDLVMVYLLGGIAGVMILCLMVPAVLIIRFLPNWRGILEGFSWSIPFGLFLLQIIDKLDSETFAARHPVFTCMLICYLTSHLLTRFKGLKLFRLRSTGRFRSAANAGQLWAKHFPDPNEAHFKNSPLTASLTLDPDDPMCRNVTYDFGKVTLHYRLQFKIREAPVRFSYDMYAIGTSDRISTYSVEIADRKTHREVNLTLTCDAQTPLVWLQAWCDDLMGQEADHFAAREAGIEDLSLSRSVQKAASKAKAAKGRSQASVPA